MPRAIYVPPPIDKSLIDERGEQVIVSAARIVRDQWTSIGTLKLGLGLNVELKGNTYSALFSLDRPVLTGSIGRILVSIGIEEVTPDIKDEDVKPLVGKTLTVINRGGKLYWYP